MSSILEFLTLVRGQFCDAACTAVLIKRSIYKNSKTSLPFRLLLE